MINYFNQPMGCNYSIVNQYGGAKLIRLYISTHDPRYGEIKYENQIEADENLYVIKSIDEGNEEATVEAVLCQDGLKSIMYAQFDTTEKTLSETLSLALADTGWQHFNAGLKTIKRSIHLEDSTPLDIVEQCKETFGVAYEIDAKSKKLTIKLPDAVSWAGLYVSDQYNLRKVDYKGDSYEFVTRLYPYGVKNDAGNALTITSVNGGCEYVENHEFSEKVVSAAWRDERFTDAQSLKDAAIAKLSTLAKPLESYECDVADIDGEIHLYDKVMLLDRIRNTRTEFQCVELEEFPLFPEKSKVTLSTVVQTIEAKISKKIQSVNDDVKFVEAKTGETALLASLMCGSLGLYKTIEKDENGGSIYYMHDAQTLADSTVVWKIVSSGIAVSNDGGKTWVAGVTAAGDAIVKTLLANKIVSASNGASSWDLVTGKFSTTASETYLQANYTQADKERLMSIITGTVDPTKNDYQKFDFNGDGRIDAGDLAIINQILARGDLTQTWRAIIDPMSKGKAVRVERDLHYGDEDTTSTAIMFEAGAGGIKSNYTDSGSISTSNFILSGKNVYVSDVTIDGTVHHILGILDD